MQPFYSVGSSPINFVLWDMTLAIRLQAAREAKKISQEALGKIVGLSQQAIQAIEDGKTLQPRKIREIAAALQTTPEKLLYGVDAAFIGPVHGGHVISELLDDNKYAFISKYNVAAGAGDAYENGHEEISGKHAYRRDWLEKKHLLPAMCAVIEVDGDSMHPTIADGDVVLINRTERRIKNGIVFAFRTEDGVRIKRLYKQIDGRVKVASDNPDKISYPDEWLTPGMEAEIIGAVVHRSGDV